MMSSRVPAREWNLGVLCKGTEPGGEWRKDREQASHSQQTGHSNSIWDEDETWTRPWRYKPKLSPADVQAQQAEGYYDQESGRHTADLEGSKKLSNHAKC